MVGQEQDRLSVGRHLDRTGDGALARELASESALQRHLALQSDADAVGTRRDGPFLTGEGLDRCGREPVVARAEGDLQVDEIAGGGELAGDDRRVDGIPAGVADGEHRARCQCEGPEPGEGVGGTTAEGRDRIHSTADGDDVAQPALGVSESQFVAVDGGEGLAVRYRTNVPSGLFQRERAGSPRDGGDTGSAEPQHDTPDALENRRQGRIAHCAVRVAHRPAVRHPGGRDPERGIARAAGILHQQLQ